MNVNAQILVMAGYDLFLKGWFNISSTCQLQAMMSAPPSERHGSWTTTQARHARALPRFVFAPTPAENFGHATSHESLLP